MTSSFFTERLFPPFALAPMAEMSDPPLRRLLSRLGGCCLHYTAMITASASRALRDHRFCLDTCHPLSPPLVTQIAPSKPEEVAEMVDNVLSVCRPFALDINMGCPVWWMRRQGAGAGLLSDPPRAFAIVEQARASWSGPLFVKIRAGISEDRPWLLDFVSGLVDHGADAIALHGRLVEERLRRVARWDLVKYLSSASPVPILGNGDVLSADLAVTRLCQSGAAAVMIGRGALRDPFIFARAAALLRAESFREPTFEEEMNARLELIDDIAATYDAGRAASRIRKLLPYLLERFPFARRHGLEIGRLGSPAEQREAMRVFLEKFSGQAQAL